MNAEKRLSEIVRGGVGLRLIEPHIYSPYPPGENTNAYDETFGTIYDIVACNPLYNRIIWGYRISEYHRFCLDALKSSAGGWVLDAGCGSLSFTARTYAGYSARPVVLLDQSIRLLKLAKSRLIKLTGKVPDNVVFLHGDALNPPFKNGIFGTVISLNLLHVLEDMTGALQELKKALSDGGSIYLTTLVENDRFADSYLRMLGKSKKLIPRSAGYLLAALKELEMPAKCRIEGNLAFVSCSTSGPNKRRVNGN